MIDLKGLTEKWGVRGKFFSALIAYRYFLGKLFGKKVSSPVVAVASGLDSVPAAEPQFSRPAHSDLGGIPLAKKDDGAGKSSFKLWIRVVAFVVIAVFIPEQFAQAIEYDWRVLWNKPGMNTMINPAMLKNLANKDIPVAVKSILKEIANKPITSLKISPTLTIKLDKPLKISDQRIEEIFNWLLGRPCGAKALFDYLGYSGVQVVEQDIAVLALTIDILHGVVKPEGNPEVIKNSMFALSQASEFFGKKLYAVKITDFSANGYNQAPFIAHFKGDHYVLVTKISDNKVYFSNEHKEEFLTKEDFLAQFSGYALTPVVNVSTVLLSESQAKQVLGARRDDNDRRLRSMDYFSGTVGLLMLNSANGTSLKTGLINYGVTYAAPKLLKTVGFNNSISNIGGSFISQGVIGGFNYRWNKDAMLAQGIKGAVVASIQEIGYKQRWDKSVFPGVTNLASTIAGNLAFNAMKGGRFALYKFGNDQSALAYRKGNQLIGSEFKTVLLSEQKLDGVKQWVPESGIGSISYWQSPSILSYVADAAKLYVEDRMGGSNNGYSKFGGAFASSLISQKFNFKRALGSALITGASNALLQKLSNDTLGMGRFSGAMFSLAFTSGLSGALSKINGGGNGAELALAVFNASKNASVGNFLSGGLATLNPHGDLYYQNVPDATFASNMLDFYRQATGQPNSSWSRDDWKSYTSARALGQTWKPSGSDFFSAFMNQYYSAMQQQASATLSRIILDRQDKISYMKDKESNEWVRVKWLNTKIEDFKGVADKEGKDFGKIEKLTIMPVDLVLINKEIATLWNPDAFAVDRFTAPQIKGKINIEGITYLPSVELGLAGIEIKVPGVKNLNFEVVSNNDLVWQVVSAGMTAAVSEDGHNKTNLLNDHNENSVPALSEILSGSKSALEIEPTLTGVINPILEDQSRRRLALSNLSGDLTFLTHAGSKSASLWLFGHGTRMTLGNNYVDKQGRAIAINYFGGGWFSRPTPQLTQDFLSKGVYLSQTPAITWYHSDKLAADILKHNSSLNVLSTAKLRLMQNTPTLGFLPDSIQHLEFDEANGTLKSITQYSSLRKINTQKFGEILSLPSISVGYSATHGFSLPYDDVRNLDQSSFISHEALSQMSPVDSFAKTIVVNNAILDIPVIGIGKRLFDIEVATLSSAKHDDIVKDQIDIGLFAKTMQLHNSSPVDVNTHVSTTSVLKDAVGYVGVFGYWGSQRRALSIEKVVGNIELPQVHTPASPQIMRAQMGDVPVLPQLPVPKALLRSLSIFEPSQPPAINLPFESYSKAQHFQQMRSGDTWDMSVVKDVSNLVIDDKSSITFGTAFYNNQGTFVGDPFSAFSGLVRDDYLNALNNVDIQLRNHAATETEIKILPQDNVILPAAWGKRLEVVGALGSGTRTLKDYFSALNINTFFESNAGKVSIEAFDSRDTTAPAFFYKAENINLGRDYNQLAIRDQATDQYKSWMSFSGFTAQNFDRRKIVVLSSELSRRLTPYLTEYKIRSTNPDFFAKNPNFLGWLHQGKNLNIEFSQTASAQENWERITQSLPELKMDDALSVLVSRDLPEGSNLRGTLDFMGVPEGQLVSFSGGDGWFCSAQGSVGRLSVENGELIVQPLPGNDGKVASRTVAKIEALRQIDTAITEIKFGGDALFAGTVTKDAFLRDLAQYDQILPQSVDWNLRGKGAIPLPASATVGTSINFSDGHSISAQLPVSQGQRQLLPSVNPEDAGSEKLLPLKFELSAPMPSSLEINQDKTWNIVAFTNADQEIPHLGLPILAAFSPDSPENVSPYITQVAVTNHDDAVPGLMWLKPLADSQATFVLKGTPGGMQGGLEFGVGSRTVSADYQPHPHDPWSLLKTGMDDQQGAFYQARGISGKVRVVPILSADTEAIRVHKPEASERITTTGSGIKMESQSMYRIIMSDPEIISTESFKWDGSNYFFKVGSTPSVTGGITTIGVNINFDNNNLVTNVGGMAIGAELYKGGYSVRSADEILQSSLARRMRREALGTFMSEELNSRFTVESLRQQGLGDEQILQAQELARNTPVSLDETQQRLLTVYGLAVKSAEAQLGQVNTLLQQRAQGVKLDDAQLHILAVYGTVSDMSFEGATQKLIDETAASLHTKFGDIWQNQESWDKMLISIKDSVAKGEQLSIEQLQFQDNLKNLGRFETMYLAVRNEYGALRSSWNGNDSARDLKQWGFLSLQGAAFTPGPKIFFPENFDPRIGELYSHMTDLDRGEKESQSVIAPRVVASSHEDSSLVLHQGEGALGAAEISTSNIFTNLATTDSTRYSILGRDWGFFKIGQIERLFGPGGQFMSLEANPGAKAKFLNQVQGSTFSISSYIAQTSTNKQEKRTGTFEIEGIQPGAEVKFDFSSGGGFLPYISGDTLRIGMPHYNYVRQGDNSGEIVQGTGSWNLGSLDGSFLSLKDNIVVAYPQKIEGTLTMQGWLYGTMPDNQAVVYGTFGQNDQLRAFRQQNKEWQMFDSTTKDWQKVDEASVHFTENVNAHFNRDFGSFVDEHAGRIIFRDSFAMPGGNGDKRELANIPAPDKKATVSNINNVDTFIRYTGYSKFSFVGEDIFNLGPDYKNVLISPDESFRINQADLDIQRNTLNSLMSVPGAGMTEDSLRNIRTISNQIKTIESRMLPVGNSLAYYGEPNVSNSQSGFWIADTGVHWINTQAIGNISQQDLRKGIVLETKISMPVLKEGRKIDVSQLLQQQVIGGESDLLVNQGDIPKITGFSIKYKREVGDLVRGLDSKKYIIADQGFDSLLEQTAANSELYKGLDSSNVFKITVGNDGLMHQQIWSGSLIRIPLQDGASLELETPIAVKDGIISGTALTKADHLGRIFMISLDGNGKINQQLWRGELSQITLNNREFVLDRPLHVTEGKFDKLRTINGHYLDEPSSMYTLSTDATGEINDLKIYSGILTSIPLQGGTSLELETPIAVKDGLISGTALTKKDSLGRVFKITLTPDGNISQQQWSGSLTSISLKGGATLELAEPIIIREGVSSGVALTKPDAQNRVYKITLSSDGSISQQQWSGSLSSIPLKDGTTL
ncbi:MAG TPA: cysteine peptidase family C39 domain-containing protein, partial [Candidatus Omnitrophota bacterium]|nr:cysteine peptidase family C39 domain-containing protein [Candidatus Omnitrophota bacterium]